MLEFDARTRERGMRYYLDGRVQSLRRHGDVTTAEVAGSRRQPYSVVLRWNHLHSSFCSCPVGAACKHLVALLCGVLADRENLEDTVLRRGIDAETFREIEALTRPPTPTPQTETAATENEILQGLRRRWEPEISLGDSEADAARRLVFVIGPARAYGAARRRRPMLAPARQYRRKDGSYGRIALLSMADRVSAVCDTDRRLARFLCLTGGEAPLVDHIDELQQTASPVFVRYAADPSAAPSSRRPARILWPTRLEVDVIPSVAGGMRSGGGFVNGEKGIELRIRITASADDGSREVIEPTVSTIGDSDSGHCVLISCEGQVLLGTDRGPLAELARIRGTAGRGNRGEPADGGGRAGDRGGASEERGGESADRRDGYISPQGLEALRAAAARFRGSLQLREPKTIRRIRVGTEPVFVIVEAETGYHLLLGLEAPERVDGYYGDEFRVHVFETGFPKEAVHEAARRIGDDPVYEIAREAWTWNLTDRREQSGNPAPIEPLHIGVALAEAGYRVYVEDLHGYVRRLRRKERLSVSARSGQDWFELHVAAPDADRVDQALLEEMYRRGAHISGDELFVLDPEELERIRRILNLSVSAEEGQVVKIDPASLAEAAELADDVEPDLDRLVCALRELLRGPSAYGEAPPAGLQARLRSYQRDGYAWLCTLARHGLGGCLADDMGLGKTVQALALMLRLREGGDAAAPACDDGAVAVGVGAQGDGADTMVPDSPRGAFLVVAPRSTLSNWEREARRFAPDLRVCLHHGPRRWTRAVALRAFDLIITSYGTAVRDAELLGQLRLRLICLDEAQFIKNPYATTTRKLKALPAELRLALTGTPVENVTTDLWSIMDFLNPGLLGSLSWFRRHFPKRPKGGTDDTIRRLRGFVAPFLLRRTKEAVAPELPPRITTLITCSMGGLQARFYATLKSYHREQVEAAIASGESAKIRRAVLVGLLRLRQAAIYPADADPTGRDVPAVKEHELVAQLREISAKGYKSLVFSQFVTALARFRGAAEAAGIDTLYLDGATTDRGDVIEAFQSSTEATAFFISLKAGGTGINVTAADYVFVCDPWWNPQVERQAVDRAHRIGRRNPVVVARLVTAETVEEKVLALQRDKQALAETLILEKDLDLPRVSREDLLSLFD